MRKKLVYLGLALIMLFSLAGLSACSDIELAQYKTTAKTAIQSHADTKIQVNEYSTEGLTEIAEIVASGKAAITAAIDKPAVDTAKADAIKAIDAVEPKEDEMEIPFPSNLEEFSDEFFEKYTLILVPFFDAADVLDENIEFYTVYVESGKLNFLTEITKRAVDGAIKTRMIAVIIPNEIFIKYEIGENRTFYTHEWQNGWVESCREWLKEIDDKIVEHRAGLFFDVHFWVSDITVVTSHEALKNLIDVTIV